MSPRPPSEKAISPKVKRLSSTQLKRGIIYQNVLQGARWPIPTEIKEPFVPQTYSIYSNDINQLYKPQLH